MTSTRVAPSRPEKTPERVDFLAPALVVSIIIAIFAVVTQLLNAIDAASLSTTQMLTAWLVAIGLIVLLWIAYMICLAYLTAGREKDEAAAKRAAEQARTAVEEAEARLDEREAAKVADWKARAASTAVDPGMSPDMQPAADGHWNPRPTSRDGTGVRGGADGHGNPNPTGMDGADVRTDAGGDAEQARTAAEEAEARLKAALAAKADAEKEAKTSRAQADNAKQAAEEQEAAAKRAAEQVRTAVEEAEARLAEWEAAKVTDWKAKAA